MRFLTTSIPLWFVEPSGWVVVWSLRGRGKLPFVGCVQFEYSFFVILTEESTSECEDTSRLSNTRRTLFEKSR